MDRRQESDLQTRSTPGATSSTSAMNEASGNISVLDAPNEVDGRVLLGERDRLDDRETRRTWTPTRRSRSTSSPTHQGVRVVPGHTSSPRGTTGCRRCGTATPDRGLNSFEDPSRYAWGLGAPNDGAVDGQLDDRARAPRTRRPRTRGSTSSSTRRTRSKTWSSTATTPGSPAWRRRREAAGSRSWTWCSSPTTQVATMHAQAINSAFDREVEIF